MTVTGVGRPRLSTRRRPGATAREEILDAAAELFTTRGFTGTSTRMIADAVGIRQASMYHHFATKDDILATLLLGTVAGPVERAEQIRLNCEDPIVRMYALALFDTSQLAAARWNLGALYLLPEVSTERFADFRRLRNELMVRYSSFALDALRANGGSDCGPGTPELPFRLVEAMIGARSDANSRARTFVLTPHTIAAASLRTLGWSGPTESIAHSAVALLDRLAESHPQPSP
ncbi:TetR/AcrR family transcriptional regulator [Rhodococcus xishaensis]|uniref:TetR/AcrR family transcriptional regulator n=1 Tax=Rhodococcus xishaensis TaxID=2487364 RepID=A0A3S3B646_9NOCA|nr:TetR/AcrR family transcriptional regulator [Rhodococcus xishaensis]RVW04034.1 TetR/AcrR family transcriptional regulator [Rhodococcus xishaensis]